MENQQTTNQNNRRAQGEPVVPPASGASQGLPPVKKRRTVWPWLLAALVLVVGLAVAAWYFLMRPTAPSAPSTETTTIENLRLGATGSQANSLYPEEILGMNLVISKQIYEGLVGFENNSFKPLLATGWTNPDETTWVFTLKPDVKFHTGKDFTAQDVKQNIEALKEVEHFGFVTSTIASVEATKPLEVKITTTEPDALLLNRLALALIRDLAAGEEVKGRDGTGAYTVSEAAEFNEKTATLVANDAYHQGKPKTRQLTFTIFDTDAEVVAALKEGKIDLGEDLRSEQTKAELARLGFTAYEYDAPGTFGLYMNMLKADTPLKNKEVRSAIAQAIDRQTVVTTVNKGHVPANQVVPSSLPGHDASLAFPPFNKQAATDMLAKTNAAQRKLNFTYIDGVQLEAPVIIEQLRAVGFNINPLPSADTTAFINNIENGAADLFTAAYVSDLLDARDLLGGLLESSEQAWPVYSDPAFDKLLADSDREFDQTKRIALLQQANKYVLDNLLWIPVRNTSYAAYHKKNIDLQVNFPSSYGLDAYYWKVGKKPE